MSEEEKRALKYFYNLRATIDESYMLFDIGINIKCEKEMIKQISTVLNLVKKQQEELEKKDKIIDKLEHIFWNYELCEYEITDCTYRKCESIADDETPPCKQCIKQYFENKVEGSK